MTPWLMMIKNRAPERILARGEGYLRRRQWKEPGAGEKPPGQTITAG